MSYPPFSVAITTYESDDVDELSAALDSIIDQTVAPSEIVVVKNGPVPQMLDAVLDSYRMANPALFSIIELPANVARGTARQRSIEECSHDLIALMDTDDIAVSDRFQRQLDYLRDHPGVDVVGGYVAEFTTDPGDPHAIRTVPLEPAAVAKTARFRCPLNQPTVMVRREALLAAGGYRSLRLMEDYELWVRMLVNGATLANVPEVLVKFRAGTEMYQRRGDLEYARAETKLLYQFYEMDFLTLPILLLNLCVRIPLRLLPNRLRGIIYHRGLRNRQ